LNSVIKFDIIDEGSNLSDHLPIALVCRFDHEANSCKRGKRCELRPQQTYLRWDHADLDSYYYITGERLQTLLCEFDRFENKCLYLSACDVYTESVAFIDNVYNSIELILSEAAKATVPSRSKQFYKFWWDQELDCLKQDSIASHNHWKAAGKPRSGALFREARTSKLRYKKRIRECQRQEITSYTNDLHEALLKKQGNAFWKCWKSKFDLSNKQIGQVSGITDDAEIASKFAEYFRHACSNLTEEGSRKLAETYYAARSNYCGLPFDDYLLFDTELVDKSTKDLSCGKAAGLDGLTAEHLQNSHPALPTVLSKLFNLMIQHAHVPESFGRSYTVPLPKTATSLWENP
jgi:hypothetical protein